MTADQGPIVRDANALLLVGIALLLGVTGPVAAQTTSPSLNSQQTLVPAPAAPLTGTDVTPLQPASSSAGTTVSVTPGVGTVMSSSVGKSFGTAGRGLPGLSGGAPVNSSIGSQDPSSTFMRPPVIPPLLCDPAVDLPC